MLQNHYSEKYVYRLRITLRDILDGAWLLAFIWFILWGLPAAMEKVTIINGGY